MEQIVFRTPLLDQRNRLFKGYVAFNEADWPTLERLLCENVKWHRHPDDHVIDPIIEGRDAVIEHLKELRGGTEVNGAEAKLLGVVSHGTASITLDFTSGGPHGDHACADKIVFDEESGCIREVWHCLAGTHQHHDASES